MWLQMKGHMLGMAGLGGPCRRPPPLAGGSTGRPRGNPGSRGKGAAGVSRRPGLRPTMAPTASSFMSLQFCVWAHYSTIYWCGPRGGAVLQSPAVLAAVAGWQLLAGPRLGLPSSFSKRQLQRAWHWTLYLASQAPGTH